MKIIERGAVYYRDKIIGFECSECGEVFSSMFGDTCRKCRREEERHQEILRTMKK